ncbi:MAG: molybdenum cofactor biosynthesis protein MoaE [Verrucomicrobiota bacterium]
MMMVIEIQIGDFDIESKRIGISERAGGGALVEFTGIVRGMEEGRLISALRYEAYQPMATNQIRRILNEVHALHPCIRATVLHRTGVVPVGQAAVYVGVEAVHRAEAFALASGFMDRLKQDVPIWKTEIIS